MNLKNGSPANSISVRISLSRRAISAFVNDSAMTRKTYHVCVQPPMQRSERQRLDPAIFHLPLEKMRDGYYSDTYFNRAREILNRDGYHPRVRMQVFQRSTSVLCGIDEALAILKLCSDGWE